MGGKKSKINSNINVVNAIMRLNLPKRLEDTYDLFTKEFDINAVSAINSTQVWSILMDQEKYS